MAPGRPLQISAGGRTSSGVIVIDNLGGEIRGSEKLYIFGNKARTGRVSCLAAQFGAIWCRSAHRESETWPKKALRIVDRDWAAGKCWNAWSGREQGCFGPSAAAFPTRSG